MPAHSLSNCPTDNQTSCFQGTSFCCPADNQCIFTSSDHKTVICCPAGSSCDTIQAITCDITKQNATLYPENPLHTTELSAKLPTCGSTCCPLGYICDTDGNCQLDFVGGSTSSSTVANGQKTLSSTASSTQNLGSGVSLKSESQNSSTTTVEPLNSNSATVSSTASVSTNSIHHSSANGIELAPGTLAGLVICIITAAILCFTAIVLILKRRRQANAKVVDPGMEDHAAPSFGKPELDTLGNQVYEKGIDGADVVKKDGTVLAEKEGTGLVEKDGTQIHELEATVWQLRGAAATRLRDSGRKSTKGKRWSPVFFA